MASLADAEQLQLNSSSGNRGAKTTGAPLPAPAAAAATPAAAAQQADQEQLPMPITSDDDEQLQPEASEQQQQEAGEVTAASQQEQQQSRKRGKPRPTHFMALQVSHCPQVQAAIAAVQSSLVEACPQLQPCLLEPVTAHLTVLVLQLTTQEQSDAAAAVLAQLGGVLQQQQQLMAPLQLELRGLSHFRNQVLYLDVAEGPDRDRLLQLGQQIIQHFREAGLMIEEGGRGFTPHITVSKTSRLSGKRHKGGRSKVKIPEDAWAPHADLAAGCVSIDEIQICSMQGRKAGEYYRVTHRLPLAAAAAAGPEAVLPRAAVAAAETEAAEAAAATQKIGGPLKTARRRFKRLLSSLVCGRPGD